MTDKKLLISVTATDYTIPYLFPFLELTAQSQILLSRPPEEIYGGVPAEFVDVSFGRSSATRPPLISGEIPPVISGAGEYEGSGAVEEEEEKEEKEEEEVVEVVGEVVEEEEEEESETEIKESANVVPDLDGKVYAQARVS